MECSKLYKRQVLPWNWTNKILKMVCIVLTEKLLLHLHLIRIRLKVIDYDSGTWIYFRNSFCM